MIRASCVLALTCLLSACAGQATYRIHPYYNAATSSYVCCEAVVTSSRDVQSVTVHAVKTGNDYTLDLTETGISASAPIAAQSGAITSVSNAISNAAAAAVKLTP